MELLNRYGQAGGASFRSGGETIDPLQYRSAWDATGTLPADCPTRLGRLRLVYHTSVCVVNVEYRNPGVKASRRSWRLCRGWESVQA